MLRRDRCYDTFLKEWKHQTVETIDCVPWSRRTCNMSRQNVLQNVAGVLIHVITLNMDTLCNFLLLNPLKKYSNLYRAQSRQLFNTYPVSHQSEDFYHKMILYSILILKLIINGGENISWYLYNIYYFFNIICPQNQS